MSAPRLARKRITLSLGFTIVLTAALSGLLVPPSRGRAPAAAKKKDKYDQAIERGLEWLARHQAKDGSWSLHQFNAHAREKPLPHGKTFTCDCAAGTQFRNDIAATAFGVLPFLGAGYGTKKTNKEPDYSTTVAAALKYLAGQQNKDGGFANNDMYAHGLATRALCDAYALTKEEAWKEPAQKALNFIIDAQDPQGGGWRYRPRQAGDLSVTGWHFIALKRGQMIGLKVPKETLQLAEHFLDSCENVETGGYGYLPGHGGSMAMTAVGLLCRQYRGVGPGNPGMQKGVQKIKAVPPEKRPDIYYLYYATQVMHNMQGDSWRFWNTGEDEKGQKKFKGVRDFLLLWQDDGSTDKHPHQKGSWSGSPGGRIMATSMALLILEQEKAQPLYRRKMPKPEK